MTADITAKEQSVNVTFGQQYVDLLKDFSTLMLLTLEPSDSLSQ